MAVVWAPAVFGDNDDGQPDAHTIAVDDDARRYGSWAEWAVDAPTQTGAAPTAIPAPTLVPVVPDPSPVPEPVQPSSGSVENITCSYDWDCDTALRVFRCENGFDAYGYWRPGVIGGQGERGIAQIHPIHLERIHNLGYTWDDMFNPTANLAVAYSLFQEQGWEPWACAQ